MSDRVEPLDEMQIAVAQPGESGAQQHLARAGLVDRDLLDRQRLVRGMKTAAFIGCSYRGGCWCKVEAKAGFGPIHLQPGDLCRTM